MPDKRQCHNCAHYYETSQQHPYGSTTATEHFAECAAEADDPGGKPCPSWVNHNDVDEESEMTDEVTKEVPKIHRFRFATDGGDAYAVAVLDDEALPAMWRVGFAFKSPMDGRNMRPVKAKKKNKGQAKKKFDLGYSIAENRARKAIEEKCLGRAGASFPMACGGMGERDQLLEEITKHILQALPPYKDHPLSLSQAFGIRPYMGLGKGDFGEWLLGSFAEQFRARHAGEIDA